MMRKTLGLAAALALTLAACSDATEDNVDETVSAPVATEDTNDQADDTTGNDDATTGDDNTDDVTGNDDTTTGDDNADDMGNDNADDSTTPAEEPGRDIDLLDYNFAVSLEDAIDISNTETGGGTIHQVGMDWSDGAWVWEIDTIADGTEWELEINATTGQVNEVESDGEDDNEQEVTPLGPVDYNTAMQTATGEISGPVTDWDLDWDDNRQQYTVEIESNNDDVEVVVDAETGDVVEIDD